MLKTVQIIALFQGIFLVFILLRSREKYRKTTYWLFLASVLAVLFFLIGDDENNLFIEDVDLFLLDSSLFITLLFLFFRYMKSGIDEFQKKDFLFFFPNLIYLLVEISEILTEEENMFVQIIELGVELTFIGYLIYIIRYPIINKAKSWVFYFAIPMAVLLSVSYFNDVLSVLGKEEINITSGDDFSSYLLLVIAFLFYFITFSLINNPKEILPNAKLLSYKKSNLNPDRILSCKIALINIMNEEKLFLDNKLSIHKVAKRIDMPRQYVSEVLNLHMHVNFQEFVNNLRVEEFSKRLESEKYDHYSLFGLACDVGFNSKSTFNHAFKKFFGLTPQEYKNKLVQDRKLRTD